MTHPPFSQLSDDTLDRVAYLVEQLRRASTTVSRLAAGGSTVAYNHLGVGGRLGDKATATRHWIGPHRDTFESLFEGENDAARAAERMLDEEAEAWARFRVMATSAREQRMSSEIQGLY